MTDQQFTVTIVTENSAFEPDVVPELAKILRRITAEIEHEIVPCERQKLFDSNGNLVGFYEWET